MSKLTQTSVSELCNQMIITGEKPSVRKIKEKLGGSFNTISEYLNHWRNEQELAKESNADISQELSNAILAEFTKVAKKVESSFNAKLNEQNEDIKEAKEELELLSTKIKQLEQDNNDLSKSLESERLAHEKKSSADEATINFLQQEKESLHRSLNEANKKYHDAELNEAVAKTKAESLEKQLQDLKK